MILPGGFSYGDYLRTGAIARFSPVMRAVERFAKSGGLVLGVCNGFQILLEAGLLPGAMLRNAGLRFRLPSGAHSRGDNRDALHVRGKSGQVLEAPVAHADGNYYCDARRLESSNATIKLCFVTRTSPDKRIPPQIQMARSRTLRASAIANAMSRG